MTATKYSETKRFRCLNENSPRLTDGVCLVMCGVENCAADKEPESRARDVWHLHAVLSGAGVLEAGGERRLLRENSLFMLKPGEPVTYYPVPDDPWTYCWMTFDGPKAAEYARAAGFTPGVYARQTGLDVRRFYRLCDQVLETARDSDGAALRRQGLLLAFIGLAIEAVEQDRDPDRGRGHKPLYHKGDYVRQALDFIQSNYSSISVADISKHLGIDRSYFSTVFRQSQGMPPAEYLLRLRMRKSGHMLETLTMSIQEIAALVGYEDALTFSKAFKRFYGVSPMRYREMTPDERERLAPNIEKRGVGPRQE